FLGTVEELNQLRLVGKAFLQVVSKTCRVYWKGRPRYDLLNLQWLDCSHNQLTQLTVPAGVRTLDCVNNQLTHLAVPEGLQNLDCSHNQLTQLTVPEGLKYCHTFNNPFNP